MTGGDGFVLGVDFGTSNTVAMLRRPDGRVTPLLFDGTPVLPSAVFAAPDGALFVGRDALHHGRHRPDGLEPNPKRRIDDGTVLLSSTACAVPDLVGAVLGRVADEATRVAGHRPATLVLSHPAGWGPVRRLTLSDAASAAGLPTPVFVPEPVAAAMYFTSVLRGSVPIGAPLLVYDLGAGTFDVTVLRAGASFEVLGSDGLDDVGGLDVDGAVVTWLRAQYDEESWERLSQPSTPADRRLRLDLWAEARVAKEMLSRTAAVVMRPPLLNQEIPLTLAEFERITQPLIDRTVRTAQGLARYCEVTAAQVLLVGGSSRIPLVATALHRAFGVPPTVTEQPETVVAEGCVFAPGVPASPGPTDVDRDPMALSTVFPFGAGLSTEPFTADFGPGALPAAPLGRSVLPAMAGGTGLSPADAPDRPTDTDTDTDVDVGVGVGVGGPNGNAASTGPAPPTDRAARIDEAAPEPAAAQREATAPAVETPAGASAPQPAAGQPAAGQPAPDHPPVARPAVVATLPVNALPPGAIPGARAGGSSGTDAGLLWPPLPPTIAAHPLAGDLDSTADTARLVPVTHGTPRNAGPARPMQRNPAQFAANAAVMSPGPTRPSGRWPAVPPPHPLSTDDDPVTERTSPGFAGPYRTTEPVAPSPRVPRVPSQPDGQPTAGATTRRTVPAQPSPPMIDDLLRKASQEPPIPPPRRDGPAQPRPARKAHPGRARAAIALFVVVFLLAATAFSLIVMRPTDRDRDAARPSPGPPFPTWAVRYADSLGTQRGWSAAADLTEKVECAFRNGRLEIDMRKGGIFRCPGQRDELTDFALRLDVYLLDGRACAGIWFRRGTHEAGKDSSYVLKVCRSELVLGHHHANGDIAEFRQFRIAELGTGVRSVVGLVVRGSDVALYLEDRFVGSHSDSAFPGGRMALGIAVPRDLGAGQVGFGNVVLRTP